MGTDEGSQDQEEGKQEGEQQTKAQRLAARAGYVAVWTGGLSLAAIVILWEVWVDSDSIKQVKVPLFIAAGILVASFITLGVRPLLDSIVDGRLRLGGKSHIGSGEGPESSPKSGTDRALGHLVGKLVDWVHTAAVGLLVIALNVLIIGNYGYDGLEPRMVLFLAAGAFWSFMQLVNALVNGKIYVRIRPTYKEKNSAGFALGIGVHALLLLIFLGLLALKMFFMSF